MTRQTVGEADGTGPRTTKPDADAPAETVDRDALHEADYGTRRSPEEDAKQGGTSADDAEGGGRLPTAERDHDYDPDGERTRRDGSET